MRDSVKLWVAALRSGKYAQGKGRLDSKGKQCCLGVGCIIYNEHHKEAPLPINNTEFDCVEYDGQTTLLPPKVKEWFGLHDTSGRHANGALWIANDDGVSFDQIADLIESNPKGLFVEDTI